MAASLFDAFDLIHLPFIAVFISLLWLTSSSRLMSVKNDDGGSANSRRREELECRNDSSKLRLAADSSRSQSFILSFRSRALRSQAESSRVNLWQHSSKEGWTRNPCHASGCEPDATSVVMLYLPGTATSIK
ncbi:hypothetical protein IW261DRAFT_1423388 [Armillaria novae-zelandiae]|uniref:Uncharacterized protein n=1 Tax=Armillaria novae-zelandiae TaxID=153914 RepID=A0AA39NXG3_9AGAR|nr:hypothetical protein IW261DRAFT_1423388 [Armillaria novae-zelandiae]